jgi:hypothetical protein
MRTGANYPNAPRRTRTFDPLIKSQTGTLENKGLTAHHPHHAPHSVANLTPQAPTDPELAAVVAAWSDLSPAIRVAIVAMVEATTPPKPNGRPQSPPAGVS